MKINQSMIHETVSSDYRPFDIRQIETGIDYCRVCLNRGRIISFYYLRHPVSDNLVHLLIMVI